MTRPLRLSLLCLLLWRTAAAQDLGDQDQAPADWRHPLPPSPLPPGPSPASAPPPALSRERERIRLAPFAGTVLERGTRDPLPRLRVSIQAASVKQEAVTDAAGRFSFAGLPEGPVRVEISGPGIRPTRSTEQLRAGRRIAVTYYVLVLKGPFQVVIRGEPVRKEVVEEVLDAQELRRIPGTQNDTLKAVQNLPGVARAPFGSGLLPVWGSAPGDTRVYADGVLIPQIYHFGGLRSTINSEFVQDLIFVPGAYGADYGRGLGGIINVETRTPKSDRIHGSVTLDLIDGTATLEGPITKNLFFAAGARVSWISAFLPLFNHSRFQISPVYWDYQLALSYRPTKRDDLDLLIFGSSDTITARITDPDPNANVDINSLTYFSRARVRWTHRFADGTVFTLLPSVGADRVTLDTGDAGVGGQVVKLDITTVTYNLRGEVRHRLHPLLDTAAGLDLEAGHTSISVLAPQINFGTGGAPPPAAGSILDASVFNAVEAAPYLIARFELLGKRLLISPELRLEIDYLRGYGGQLSHVVTEPEPRLLVRGEVVPSHLWLKAAAGIYHEQPMGAQLSMRFGNPQLDPEIGVTYVLGADADITPTLHAEVQGFYKDLRSLIVPDNVTRYDNGGIGRVYGGELLIRQKLWRNFFGWVAYTLSRSERKDRPEDPWYLFQFDQTHILTIIASYKLPWGLEAGVRFRYVTGDPTTPTISGTRNVATQNYEPVLGGRNTARLPAFNQLDVRIDKTFTFNRWRLGLFLDIQNIYNEQNTETLVYGGRQLYQQGRVTGIPFFPDLGVRADF